MTEWLIWPIFIIQLLAFCLLFFSSQIYILNIRIKTIAFLLILLTNLMIAVSLYHDSTNNLYLYF